MTSEKRGKRTLWWDRRVRKEERKETWYHWCYRVRAM